MSIALLEGPVKGGRTQSCMLISGLISVRVPGLTNYGCLGLALRPQSNEQVSSKNLTQYAVSNSCDAPGFCNIL